MTFGAGRAVLLAALACAGCGKSESPGNPTPTQSTATLVITFTENPVPYRSSGCSGATPQGWYTTARIQETSGVAFTPSTLTQKLDGAASSMLTESFASKFGACAGSTTTNPAVIAANGAACGTVGICTTGTYANYQLELAGTDANGHTLTVSSPVLQFGAR